VSSHSQPFIFRANLNNFVRLILDVKPFPIAVVRTTAHLSNWPSQFRHSLDKVYDAIKAGHIRHNGRNVMVYHPREDGRVDIECGVETNQRFEPVDEVLYSETPSGKAVTTAHIGPYQNLGSSHNALAEWSRKNGYQLTGIRWEIYGHWHDNPAEVRTDIFHLVR
jgi:effector-binding domain-containing protein